MNRTVSGTRRISRRAVLLLSTLLSGFAFAGPAAEHLAEAVRFPTISYQKGGEIDEKAWEGLHGFLEDTYPRVYAQLKPQRVNGYSLLIHWPGSNPTLEPVLFTSHMDVVPIEPGTEGDWEQPPFAGAIVNGRIYGRGTLDDKVGVIGLLEALEASLVAGIVPKRTIYFAFGHDEEVSGEQGAGKIAEVLKAKGVKFEYMIDEGGFIASDNPLLKGHPTAVVNVAEKTYFTLTLTVRGEGGHSSRPPLRSTIGILAEALDKIENNPFPAKLVPPVTDMIERMAAYMDQPQRFFMQNLWLGEPFVIKAMEAEPVTRWYVRTSTALTMINAGIKENVVPQIATAKVNFRLLPGDTPAYVTDTIRGIIDDERVELSSDTWAMAPPVADSTGSGFAMIETALKKSIPDVVVVPSLVMGATDTRHYKDLVKNIYRFHPMMIESADVSSIHGTNESITVDSFERAVLILQDMLKLAANPE